MRAQDEEFLVPISCFAPQNPVGGDENIGGLTTVDDWPTLQTGSFDYDMQLSAIKGCVVNDAITGLQFFHEGPLSTQELTLGFLGDEGGCVTTQLEGRKISNIVINAEDYVSSVRFTLDDETRLEYGSALLIDS